MNYRFAAPDIELPELSARTADMWADLAFDTETLAWLRRNGLALDGVRLTGRCPYVLERAGPGAFRVTVEQSDTAGALIDLWRVHFMRGLRPILSAA